LSKRNTVYLNHLYAAAAARFLLRDCQRW